MSGSRRSPPTTARSIRPTTRTYILAFHRDPSQTQASRRSTPPSNPPKPGTSSTSRTPRVTTTTPRPTKSSAASSSSTASSRSAGRLLLLGGEPGGEPAVSLYKAGFAAAGIEASCEVRTVAATELADAIARIRADRSVLGAAVTMPHTVAASRLLDGLGPEAQVIKAVNTISHRAGALIGWNTDRPAFSLALEDAGFQAKGRSVLVLGAGGAARASVDALRETAPRIWVSSRDLDEARAVCRDLEVSSGGPAPLGSLALLVRKAELIVNATPVGSDGQSVLFPIDWITPGHFIFDLIYQPPVTPLVRGARERGARAINGLTMLLFQGLAAFEIWTGQAPPEAAMRAALERAVVERLKP
ncbi:MAG: shikimate dehydrogenase [Chloroflexi bacterium]|nr:MAG: shikimate dehydrogenase [Chloroflexota bacterium]